MPAYRALFLRRSDRTEETEAAFASPLAATTIQGAIDEARTLLSQRSDVTSIDIFAGDDKVETVGVGCDPSRT